MTGQIVFAVLVVVGWCALYSAGCWWYLRQTDKIYAKHRPGTKR